MDFKHVRFIRGKVFCCSVDASVVSVATLKIRAERPFGCSWRVYSSKIGTLATKIICVYDSGTQLWPAMCR